MRLRIRAPYFLIVSFGVLSAGCHLRHGVVHRVESGDTLIQIAHVYGVDLAQILAANRIDRPNDLRPGQKILIPGADASRRIEKSIWEFDDQPLETAGNEAAVPSETEPLVLPTPMATSLAPVASKADVSKKREEGPTKFQWPVRGKVVSTFGLRNQKMHNGIDIRVESGARVGAALTGEVAYVGKNIEGYGNLLILRHRNGIYTVYAYLGELLVTKGALVKQSVEIATSSRKPGEAFIHFEIRKGKKAVNPEAFLPVNSGR